MKIYIYAILLMSLASAVHASDSTAQKPVFSSDKNTLYIDDNSSEETPLVQDINATNWFYYRKFIRYTGHLYKHYFLSPIDATYDYGTDAVIVVSSGIDYTLYQIINGSYNSMQQTEDNLTAEQTKKSLPEEEISEKSSEDIEEYLASQEGKTDLPQQLSSSDKKKGERTYLISKWFARKSISDDFLDKTNDSYIRLRGGYAYSYRGIDQYIYSITARLKIPRTQEKLDLIIGDTTKSSSDLSLEGTEEERDDSIALSINNILGLLEPVDSNIRLGFSGIANPYAKASFNYEALAGLWLIVPHQTFRYSLKDEFEEWTNLTFSHRVASQMMFSLLFQRSTISRVDGMNYFTQAAVSSSLGKYGNLTPYVGAYGRTKEQPADKNGYRPVEGIYSYAFGLNWSKQGTRKYIVYRIQPILSYDDQYSFKPNYSVKGLLEFYFGLRD